jgi:hypothetical protein
VELIRDGCESGVFEARHSERWNISVTIALGHVAGQQVTAGRMTPDEAGAAYRDSILRLVLEQPTALVLRQPTAGEG